MYIADISNHVRFQMMLDLFYKNQSFILITHQITVKLSGYVLLPVQQQLNKLRKVVFQVVVENVRMVTSLFSKFQKNV